MTKQEFDEKVDRQEPISMGDIYQHDEGWDECSRRLKRCLDSGFELVEGPMGNPERSGGD